MIGLRIEPRYEVSRAMVYSMPVLAVALTLAAGIGLLCGLGIDVRAALYHYFIAPFETLSSIGEVLIKAAPLIMMAVGLGLAFAPMCGISARKGSSRSAQWHPAVSRCSSGAMRAVLYYR